MNDDNDVKELIGRIFVNYVKKSLQRSKRDYVRKQNQDLYRMLLLGDLILNNSLLASTSQHDPSENYILLLHTSRKLRLSTKEQKIFRMKFVDDKTDKEIAEVLGITRQAVSKSKSQLLIKLRKHMSE